MEVKNFLQGVLSENGFYCVFAAHKETETKVTKFYETIEEVERAAMKFDSSGMDTYFALATFQEPTNRKHDNAYEFKSLFFKTY